MHDKIDMYDFMGTPDDENCLVKCLYYTKYTSITGAILSVYEMVLLSKPATTVAIAGRFLHLTLPCVAAGFVYGTTTCLTAKLRGEDDCMNHVAGSFGALSVWVAKHNRMMLTFPIAMVLASFMGYFKYMRQHNMETFKMVPKYQRRYYPFLDFTVPIYKEAGRPTTWQASD